ncbi:MAG: hypothetical protein WA431_05780 [Candidatus Cybelea sp.]
MIARAVNQKYAVEDRLSWSELGADPEQPYPMQPGSSWSPRLDRPYE